MMSGKSAKFMLINVCDARSEESVMVPCKLPSTREQSWRCSI